MLEFLNTLDSNLFLFINQTLANPITDFAMPFITSGTGLKIVYALAMIILLWKGDKRLRWMVLFSALVIVGTDQLSAGLLKDLIGRMRPCHVFDPEQINLLVGCGGGKAMPSAHAANAFGQAMFWSFYDKQPRVYLFIYASLIALSRVMVGVHYPGDIFIGGLLGIGVGLLIALLFGLFKQYVIDKNRSTLRQAQDD